MRRSRMLQRVLNKSGGLLLDTYSGAVGAYSLRYLSSSFVGNDVVLVRRGLDDAEQGFTPDEITNGALESFCGFGDGFVKIRYDQSGNENNLNQLITLDQPKIVDSGSVIFKNTRPAIDYSIDGYFQSIENQLITLPDTGMTISSVGISNQSTTINDAFYGFSGSDDIIFYPNDVANGGGGVRVFWRNKGANVINEAGTNFADTQLIYSTIYTDNNVTCYRNSKLVESIAITGTSTSGWVNFNLGAWDGGQNFNGYEQEIILWAGDKESDIIDIDSNINNYYNVF